MANPKSKRRFNLNIPFKLYREARVVCAFTGESLTSLCNRALSALVSDEKKRMNEAVIPPDVIKSMQEYEMKSGMSPKEQVAAMAAYWFRIREINDDRNEV